MIYLYIWTLVSVSYGSQYHDWQYFGAFDTPTACHTAAANLSKKNYRCISKHEGSVK